MDVANLSKLISLHLKPNKTKKKSKKKNTTDNFNQYNKKIRPLKNSPVQQLKQQDEF